MEGLIDFSPSKLKLKYLCSLTLLVITVHEAFNICNEEKPKWIFLCFNPTPAPPSGSMMLFAPEGDE
jgi:hypothetical protein